MLGILAIIGTFTQASYAITWLKFGFNAFSGTLLLVTLLSAYAAVRYLLMVFQKDAHSKEQYANAYKCYTNVLSFIIILAGIFVELFLIYVLVVLGNVDVSGGAGGLIGLLVRTKAAIIFTLILIPICAGINLMLLGHFKKVIHAYSEKHDEYIKC